MSYVYLSGSGGLFDKSKLAAPFVDRHVERAIQTGQAKAPVFQQILTSFVKKGVKPSAKGSRKLIKAGVPVPAELVRDVRRADALIARMEAEQAAAAAAEEGDGGLMTASIFSGPMFPYLLMGAGGLAFVAIRHFKRQSMRGKRKRGRR